MSYGKGLFPSDAHRIAHRLAARRHQGILDVLSTGTIVPTDLREFMPPTFDQNRSRTCGKHAICGAIYTARAAAGTPLPWVPSPLHVASCVYADMRASVLSPQDDVIPTLRDTGSQLQDDVDAVAQWGLRPINPFPNRYSDVPGPEVQPFPEPDLGSLEVGFKNLFDGEYQITIDDSAPSVVAASLQAKVPVFAGGFVDTIFENLGPNDVAQPTNQADPNGGGHAYQYTASRLNSVGYWEFWLQNSWGSGWGKSGGIWVSTGFVLASWGLWPCAAKPEVAV